MKIAKWCGVALVLGACASTRGAPAVRAERGQEFRVRQGDVAQVESLRLRFVRVTEDSRCPINARCIRAGSAKVQVELRAPGMAAAEPVLETPDTPRGATFGPYEVEVTDLQPGRDLDAPAPRFEAAFRVRRR
jgi:hypothetical protein